MMERLTQTAVIGVLVLLVSVGALAGATAAQDTSTDTELLNGSVTETVDTGGQIVITANYTEIGSDNVTVTAADPITVVTGDDTNETVTAGTEILVSQNKTLEATDGDLSGYSYVDVLELEVSGSNITSTVDGVIEEDSVNVTVGLEDRANATVDETSVSFEGSGLFSGGLLGGTSSTSLLLFGGLAVLAFYVFRGRDD